jgi:hypothetical protein
MKATVLDLRYRMNEVLKALDKREKVTLLYHGRVKGTIHPEGGKQRIKVEDHPFFGMNSGEDRSVSRQMEGLRRSRSDAV